jgi:hypothetical protein
MAVTEVTNQSWFARLGNSLKGLLMGAVLFAAGVWLLAWNEGRAVKTAKGLEEGAAAVISIQADQIDPAHEGRLVHLTGLATSPEILKDDLFSVSAPALKLRREAEMYQWRERQSSKTRTKVGGGTETVTTYEYEKVWADELIRSEAFKEPNGHTNPTSMPVSSETQVAKSITVGALDLSPGLISQVGQFEALPLPAALPEGWTALDGQAFRAANPQTPQVGDLRVRFEAAPPVEVSVIAVQRGRKLEPYRTQTDTIIEMLNHGNVAAAQMFEQAVAANTTMTWLLRLGGWLLLFIGVKVLLAPLAVAADLLPFLGSILRFGTSLIAALISIPTSIITIAVAWIAYRPAFAIALLALAVILPVLIVLLRGRNKSASASALQPPPVPPAAL